MKQLPDKPQFQKWLPYIIAIVIFLVLSIAYVSPILEGKRLWQPDIVNFAGMAQEIREFREETGEEALWTNSMFGGMPAFQISVIYGSNISNFFHNIMTLWLPRPADMIFLYFAGFFILLLLMRVNPWIAVTGAIAFAFASYNFIILEAGHNSKAVAMGYMAPVLASIIYTFRGNYLQGGLLFAIFMSLQLFANHYQITYYLLIIVVIYGLFQLYETIKNKELVKGFLKPAGILLTGLIIAIGVNIGNIWSTYSYAPHTMRGGTELTIADREVSDGLSKEYITQWSYGIGETFSLMIPNIKGGATGVLGDNQRALEQVDPRMRSSVAQWNHYWGDQPFTSGPVYVGAIVIIFFAIGLYLFKGRLKWALLIAAILSVLLSWGKNFMPLTEFFIDHVPWYNKFRAVSMTLVIAGLCISFIAFKGLQRIFENPGVINIKDRKFLLAVGLTLGLAFVFYVAPRLFFDFISQNEMEMIAAQSQADPQAASQIGLFVDNIERARIAVFRADTIRSIAFMALALIILIVFTRKKIGKPLFIAIITLLILVDMWAINRRYLNNDNFESKQRVENPYDVTQADNYIMDDPDHPHFRVLDLTESTFNSSRTSYFHMSLGGYHGAKLQRYQEIIELHLQPNIGNLVSTFDKAVSLQQIIDKMTDKPVMNMLNTRYIIYSQNADPIKNPYALGNAWMVQDYRIVQNADEEMLALNDFDPERKAIIDKRFAQYVEGKSFIEDSSANIELIHYQPNKLVYHYGAGSKQLAVFSEIFYEDGWKSFVNGESAPHFRVNYVLRAMVLPPGENEIEFRFEPVSYYQGERIAFAFSALMVLLIVGFIGKEVYNAYYLKEKKEWNADQADFN